MSNIKYTYPLNCPCMDILYVNKYFCVKDKM